MGVAVRDLRAQRGWSQHELARRVGWTQGTVYRIERGLVNVTVDHLCDVSAALGVRPSRLVANLH